MEACGGVAAPGDCGDAVSAERFLEARTLYYGALDLPEDERAAYLSSACGNDEDLRRDVESLLDASAPAGRLESVVLAEVAGLPDGPAAARRRARPARIGPYEVVGDLGRGGMGDVYLGVHRGVGFERRAALKVVRIDLASDLFLERFHSERHILSTLEHPNIARLYDGGTTEEGLPWFAMEFVDGEHLLEFADRRSLARAERIRLFLDIAAAVQFAHQNLVVHRDLKPGNILVTKDGVPKLLDFGLAKLLDVSSSERTATVHRLLTPEYASPEQVRGERIATASDVYSLGVVLYRLLTGALPYRTAHADPREFERAVLDQVPPSTAPLLGTDLETVLGKALAKEPERRYASVEQFANDLRRFLDGRPVLARPDTLGYRAGKFLRRHLVGAAAAAAVIVALAAGAGIALREARHARRSEAIARRRFDDVRSLAKSVLFELHDAIAPLPGSTRARATLVSTALKYLDALAAEAGTDPALAREVAAGYARLGRVQGGPNSTLGDKSGALQSHRSAIRLLEPLVKTSGATDEDRANLASELDVFAYLLGRDHPDGLATHERALEIRRGLLAKDESSRDARRGVARSYDSLADYHSDRKDWARAIELRRKERDLFEGLARDPSASGGDRRNLALSDKTLGGLLHRMNDFGGARALYEEAISLDEARLAGNPDSPEALMDLSFSLGSLGSLAVDSGDLSQGRALYTRALALRQAVAAADPANAWARSGVTRAHARLADIEEKLGHNAAAESHRLQARPSGS